MSCVLISLDRRHRFWRAPKVAPKVFGSIINVSVLGGFLVFRFHLHWRRCNVSGTPSPLMAEGTGCLAWFASISRLRFKWFVITLHWFMVQTFSPAVRNSVKRSQYRLQSENCDAAVMCCIVLGQSFPSRGICLTFGTWRNSDKTCDRIHIVTVI